MPFPSHTKQKLNNVHQPLALLQSFDFHDSSHTTPRCYLYVRKREGKQVREQGPVMIFERIRGTDPWIVWGSNGVKADKRNSFQDQDSLNNSMHRIQRVLWDTRASGSQILFHSTQCLSYSKWNLMQLQLANLVYPALELPTTNIQTTPSLLK